MRKLFILILLAIIVSGCAQDSTKAVSEESKPIVNYLEEGKKSLQEGDIAGAISNLDRAVIQNPRDLTGYVILGQLYMRLNNVPKAIEVLLASTRVRQDNGEVYYLLANCFMILGKSTEAIETAKKSVDIFLKQKEEGRLKKSLVLLKSLVDASESNQDK
ncbi:MAG: tetratricopeptide repeat protein [Candidatus Zapsychrus exili]|nr:tetratricopeptide repeat protein [Candidatus Zapsychrus exili]